MACPMSAGSTEPQAASRTPLFNVETRSWLGHARSLSGPGYFDYIRQLVATHGSFLRLKVPGTSVVVIAEGVLARKLIQQESSLCKGISYRKLRAMLGDGLVTSEGPSWQQHRNAIDPFFSPTAVQNYSGLFAAATARRIARWQAGGPRHVCDLTDEMRLLTLEIIVSVLLGTPVSEEQGGLAEAFTTALEMIAESSLNLFEIPRFIPTRRNRRLNKALAQINQLMDSLGAEARIDESAFAQLKRAGAQQWSPAALKSEMVNLLFAGHETTTQALTWSMICLARSPEWIEKIRAEWRNQAPPTSNADLARFKVTRAVVTEVLRLYPAVPTLAKEAAEELELDGNRFAKGTIFILSPWLIQRNLASWGPTANAFDPGRFLGRERTGQGAMLPFSMGSRNCIGLHFANLELVTVLGMTISQGTFEIPQAASLQPKVLGTLRASARVNATFTPYRELSPQR